MVNFSQLKTNELSSHKKISRKLIYIFVSKRIHSERGTYS